jgi:anti-sigma B factor antagonist
MTIEVTEEIRSTARIVSIAGELDLEGAPRARGVFEGASSDGGRALVVDLTACTFIDSTGISAIVSAARPLQNGQAKVAIAALHGSEPRRALELAGIDLSIVVADTLEEAVSAATSTD